MCRINKVGSQHSAQEDGFVGSEGVVHQWAAKHGPSESHLGVHELHQESSGISAPFALMV